MKLTYKLFTYSDSEYCRQTVPVIMEMSKRSFQEAQNSDDFNPPFKNLIEAWRAGTIKIVLATDNVGKPAGFQLWSFLPSLSGRSDASMFSIFIERQYRGGSFREFRDFGIMAMSAAGADRKFIIVDAGSKMDKLLTRDGYTDKLIYKKVPE